jgi:hypothetical protein
MQKGAKEAHSPLCGRFRPSSWSKESMAGTVAGHFKKDPVVTRKGVKAVQKKLVEDGRPQFPEYSFLQFCNLNA